MGTTGIVSKHSESSWYNWAVTTWAIQDNDGIICYTGTKTCYRSPGQAHQVYISDSKSGVANLVDILRDKGVWKG